jgi:hypothetical protein
VRADVVECLLPALELKLLEAERRYVFSVQVQKIDGVYGAQCVQRARQRRKTPAGWADRGEQGWGGVGTRRTRDARQL